MGLTANLWQEENLSMFVVRLFHLIYLGISGKMN
jgi:hypothetical protein